jgi:hypothetical protein
LVSVVPLGTVSSTVAIRKIVAELPDGKVSKVIVRLLPEPPQVPPLLAVQEK